MGQDQTKILQKQLFDIKLTAKQLARESSKAEQRAGAQKLKLKAAIEKGDIVAAKIYAENVMREKRQVTDLLHLSSRMDGVAQRVEQALIMGKITKSMSGVVTGMDKALASMDAAKIAQVMDKFEKQFEELDVQTSVMNTELERTTGSAINDAEVSSMMQMVADEYGLKLATDLQQAPISKPAAVAAPEDELEARMRALNS